MEPTEVTPQIRGHFGTRTPVSRVLAQCAFTSPYWADCEGPLMPSQGEWPQRSRHVWTEQVRATVGAGWAGKGGYLYNLSPTRPSMDCLGQDVWHLIACEGKLAALCVFACLFEEKVSGDFCYAKRDGNPPWNGEFRTIRKQDGKAALLVSLEHKDLNWLFSRLELGWVKGPVWESLPGTEERGGPSGLERPGQAI